MQCITIKRARTWRYRKMRPCIEKFSGPVSLSPFQSWPDCIINTSGYDFRKGQAAAWPLAVAAQQSDRVHAVGVLMNLPEPDSESRARIAALRDGLRKLGWIEGRNLQIATRWGASDIDRAKGYAAELVAIKPEVIFAGTTVPLTALHQPIRSRVGLFRASLIREVISPDFPTLNTLSRHNGLSCSSKLLQGSLALPSSTTPLTRSFLESCR